MARIEGALGKVTGRAWNVRVESASGNPTEAAPQEVEEKPNLAPPRSRRQRQEAMENPLVKRAVELLGAQIVDVEDGFGAAPEPSNIQVAADETEER